MTIKRTPMIDHEKAKRQQVIAEVVGAVNKECGENSIFHMGSTPSLEIKDALSTGTAVDELVGHGGIVRGRIVEVYGPESSGKTTLALQVVAQAQRAGGEAAFIDAEHALDPTYAKKLGVSVDDLLLSQPNSGEQALETAIILVENRAVDVVVIDSVAALTPQRELDGDMGAQHVGLQSRMMAQGLRKISALANKNHVIVVFINQIRMKIGVMFGNPETTPGGNALKFYASYRLSLFPKGPIIKAKEKIGVSVNVRVVKNKLFPPFRQAVIPLIYNKGFGNSGTVQSND